MKTLVNGVIILASGFGLIFASSIYTYFVQGGSFAFSLPPGFLNIFKIFLLGLFIILVIINTASRQRLYANQIEPFRYIKIKAHNTKDGQGEIGLEVKNYNQREISRVHGTITQVTKDNDVVKFQDENLFFPGIRKGDRASVIYSTENDIKPFKNLFIVIASQKPDGTSYWLSRNDVALQQLPSIVPESRYIIVIRVNVHRTAGNQLIHQKYEVEMGYVSNTLKVRRIKRIE